MSYLFYIALFIFILVRLSRWIKQQYMATLEEVEEQKRRERPSGGTSSSPIEEAPIEPITENLQDAKETVNIPEPYLLALPEEELKNTLLAAQKATPGDHDEEAQLDTIPVANQLHSMLYNRASLRNAFVLSELLRPKYTNNERSSYH